MLPTIVAQALAPKVPPEAGWTFWMVWYDVVLVSLHGPRSQVDIWVSGPGAKAPRTMIEDGWAKLGHPGVLHADILFEYLL